MSRPRFTCRGTVVPWFLPVAALEGWEDAGSMTVFAQLYRSLLGRVLYRIGWHIGRIVQ